MKLNKTQNLLILHQNPNHQNPNSIMDEEEEADELQPIEPSILHLQQDQQEDQLDQQDDQEQFSLPSISEIVVFRDEDDEDEDNEEKQVESPSPSSSDIDDSQNRRAVVKPIAMIPPHLRTPAYINPEPHISTQFYTFNGESHALMVLCILERRLATPDEIRRATPWSVLKSWRSVWKDRNEDTAYLTAWKRIQEKLNAHIDANGNQVLYFKNNSQQYVSHFDQWQDIVMSYHRDADSKHVGLKETIDRIKQVWTVGAKFYGIPESFIRICVSSCPVCSGPSGSATKSKRRRKFEYTESLEVPAKEVPHKLQQLAAKHKVVLCIRQKYIKYKPFMAEVKDYACHRAGEPAVKRSKILKREPYASKRCGCGFRIRTIVPITNYNEKDKTFVYEQEGMAVFLLYTVHTGHEPGPMDGNARIIHRVVGHKGGILMDQDTVYGMSEDMEADAYNLLSKDDGDLQTSVMHQVQELKVEVGLLEGKLMKIPKELLASLSQELSDVVNRLRSIGEEDVSRPVELPHDKQQSDDAIVGESDLAHWGDHDHEQIYGDGKDTELIEEDEDSFGRTLENVVVWDRMRTEGRSRKSLLSEDCKSDNWLKDACGEFEDKGILNCEDSKLIKPLMHDGEIETDAGLVGIQVDSFYPENSKWYDSPCSLDPGADCGDSGFRHGEIV